jgi:hypothetical protein
LINLTFQNDINPRHDLHTCYDLYQKFAVEQGRRTSENVGSGNNSRYMIFTTEKYRGLDMRRERAGQKVKTK